MFINDEFKEIVIKKYEEALAHNQSKIVINEKTLGDLTLFINEKPLVFIASFKVGEDHLYVGSNDSIGTSN